MNKRWEIWLYQAFGLDFRTLALVRVGFACLLLADLGLRFSGLRAHYTAQGMFPHSLYLPSGFPNTLSLYALGESSVYVGLLFFLNALAAVALLLGWRTRLATVLCWVFLHSLHNRNYLLLNGGDTWLRMMLFWSMFLPLGERWSMDAVRRPEDRAEGLLNLATLAFVSQVFLVYLFAGLYKTGPAWWTDLTAVQLTMMAHEWTGELAYYILYYPKLMSFLTASVLWLELVGPWLFFSPIANGPLRTLVVFGFFGFHLGLGLFMELGIFPAVGMVSVLGLLPAWFWERTPAARLALWLNRFCSRFGSDSPQGERNAPRLSRPEQGILCCAFLAVLFWNLDRAYGERLISPTLRVLIRVPRLDQYWGLFAPNAPVIHSWFLAVGTRANGEQVDLLREGRPLDWSPPSSAAAYPNQRSKRLLVALASQKSNYVRGPLARYFYQEGVAQYPDLQKVEVYRLYRSSSYADVPPKKQLYSVYQPD